MIRAREPGGTARAVVWDIGRVLVQWDHARIWREAIPDPAARARFVAEVVPESWHMAHDAGAPWSAMVVERKARFPAHADLIELYRSNWLESVPGPVPGTHALVESLAERGVPQFALTNFGADAWALFRPTFPVLGRMRDIVVSGHERLVKPDPAIFALAAARFGHDPAALLFIDDNAENVAAAARAGWHTHHFAHGAQALAADLRARGLL